jgi:hypothetical protein
MAFMSKRGNVELYIFLVFAAMAGIGLTYTILNDEPSGMAYHGGPWQDMPIDANQIQSPDGLGAGGMIPSQDDPGNYMIGTRGSTTDCQSQCFGTEGGEPLVGQEPLGGSELRQCLANCQAGVSYTQQTGQECYTCSDSAEAITAGNQGEARMVCKRVGGSSAQITNVVPGPCKY